jgi:hypothetical protein
LFSFSNFLLFMFLFFSFCDFILMSSFSSFVLNQGKAELVASATGELVSEFILIF